MPTVTLEAYEASRISGADSIRIGFASSQLAITAIIASFLFIFYPEHLLLEITAIQITYRIAISVARYLPSWNDYNGFWVWRP